MAAAIAIQTIDGKAQFVQIRQALQVLGLANTDVKPLNTVYNSTRWQSSGEIQQYKGHYIQRGNMNDLRECYNRLYGDKSEFIRIKNKSNISKDLAFKLRYYSPELMEVFKIDGIATPRELIKDLVDMTNFDNFSFSKCPLQTQITNMKICIKYERKDIFTGHFDKILSHIALQRVFNHVMYINSNPKVIALYI